MSAKSVLPGTTWQTISWNVLKLSAIAYPMITVAVYTLSFSAINAWIVIILRIKLVWLVKLLIVEFILTLWTVPNAKTVFIMIIRLYQEIAFSIQILKNAMFILRLLRKDATCAIMIQFWWVKKKLALRSRMTYLIAKPTRPQLIVKNVKRAIF